MNVAVGGMFVSAVYDCNYLYLYWIFKILTGVGFAQILLLLLFWDGGSENMGFWGKISGRGCFVRNFGDGKRGVNAQRIVHALDIVICYILIWTSA